MSRAARSLVRVSLLVFALAGSPALAQAAFPAPHEDVAFDVMNVLSHHGLHDIENELWNAYGQTTYISSWKLPFSAPYTNLNGARTRCELSASGAYVVSHPIPRRSSGQRARPTSSPRSSRCDRCRTCMGSEA
jgi:hypothetical protein